MKKLCLAILLLAAPAVCEATTYWVGPGLAHETFTALIADIEEQDGDIIYLQRDVTYAETLNIYANLDIRPFGTGAMPIIDATGLDYAAIIWGAKTCKINGFEMFGSNGGLLSVQSGQLGVWQAENMYLRDNTANPCVTASGSGGYVKSSTLLRCANTGIQFTNASNWEVSYNSIIDVVANDSAAYHDGAGSGNWLHHNLLDGAPENCVDMAGDYRDLIIEDNEMMHSLGYVIGTPPDGSAPGELIIRRNKIHDCAMPLYIVTPAKIYNNWIYNVDDPTIGTISGASGVYLLPTADGTEIVNNTIVTSDQATGRPMIYGQVGLINLIVKNNIFDMHKDQPIYDFRDTTYAGFEIDYNRLRTVYTPRLGLLGGVTIYATFSDWQTTGFDAHSTYGDPVLDNQGRPTAKSPYEVKRGGDLLDGYPSIAGKWNYIGARPWLEGNPGIPGKPMTKISGGPGLLGGGTIYHAPAEEYLGNYFLDGSTVFLDGSTYFVDGGL